MTTEPTRTPAPPYITRGFPLSRQSIRRFTRWLVVLLAVCSALSLNAEMSQSVTIEATPFSSAVVRAGVLVLKMKANWVVDGKGLVKAGEELTVAPGGKVVLSERHTVVEIRFLADRRVLIDTTFDARSFGGKVEQRSEVLTLK